MPISTALSNLEAAAFNLWLVANNVGAEIEHGTENPQPLGRALRQEAGHALTVLFEWRRLRCEATLDPIDYVFSTENGILYGVTAAISHATLKV
jgi:hypothetical protein